MNIKTNKKKNVLFGCRAIFIALFIALVLVSCNGWWPTLNLLEYYKLGSDGHKLAIQNATWSETGTEGEGTTWSCALDGSGLVWEIKTDDGGTRDRDFRYRWGGKTADAGAGGTYYKDWDVLVDAANSENGTGLCGYTDWRLPTAIELETLIRDDSSNPPVTTPPLLRQDIFPHTAGWAYWTSSANAFNTTEAWAVDFVSLDRGKIHLFNDTRDTLFNVRLVRGKKQNQWFNYY